MPASILHCDCNSFFASVEMLDNPALRDVPLAVAGNPASRRGVVLARNELARQHGIYTTQTVFDALRRCPGLTLVPPRHHRYQEVSQAVNQVYLQFTDQVEPASIDESFLDITGSLPYFRMIAREMADAIRHRVRETVGVTISVGVSDCKIFAKMGSNMKKPDATTEITRQNYQQVLWPLPINRLHFAGQQTCRLLEKSGIHTIGDLARSDKDMLTSLLGKSGEMLWRYAHGQDEDKVLRMQDRQAAKSVGSGRTYAFDLVSAEAVRSALSQLADDVAGRLRLMDRKCRALSIHIKDPAFAVISRRRTLDAPTWLQKELSDSAMALLQSNWAFPSPIRALTLTAESLVSADEITQQLTFFAAQDDKERKKREQLESAVSALRQKHGYHIVGPGMQREE